MRVHCECYRFTCSCPWLLQASDIKHLCCSAFVVSRSRILAHPKAMYEALLRFADSPVSSQLSLFWPRFCQWPLKYPKKVPSSLVCMTLSFVPSFLQPVPTNRANNYLEWTWHKIFGQPWADVPPKPEMLCPSNPQACISQAMP